MQLPRRPPEAAFSRFHELNAIFSDYDPQSELRRLCDTSSEGKPVRVSDDLWRVLVRADRAFRTVGGGVRRDRWAGGPALAQRPAHEGTPFARVASRRPSRESVIGGFVFIPQRQRWNCCGRRCGWISAASPRAMRSMRRMKAIREHGIARMMVEAGGNIGLGDPPPEQARLAHRHRPARRSQPAAPVSLAFARGDFHLRRSVAVRRHRRRPLFAPDQSANRHGADRSQQRDRRGPRRSEHRRSFIGRGGARAQKGTGARREHARRRGVNRSGDERRGKDLPVAEVGQFEQAAQAAGPSAVEVAYRFLGQPIAPYAVGIGHDHPSDRRQQNEQPQKIGQDSRGSGSRFRRRERESSRWTSRRTAPVLTRDASCVIDHDKYLYRLAMLRRSGPRPPAAPPDGNRELQFHSRRLHGFPRGFRTAWSVRHEGERWNWS